MTQPIQVRREFNQAHYVSRPLETEEALRWLTDQRDRVLLVTGPPAIGKTWFLQYLQHLFIYEGAIPFWVDTVTELLPEGDLPAKSKQGIDPDKQNEWVRKFAQNLKEKCPQLLPLRPEMTADEYSDYIEKAMGEFCDQCYQGKTIVIFIDQGDEVEEASWRDFEKKILERFFSVKQIKIVIAFRQDQRLFSAKLRWMQRTLPLGTFPMGIPGNRPGEEQIEKLTGGDRLKKQQADNVFESIPTYQKNYTGLNTFIYEYAIQNLQLPLSRDLLKDALIAINPLIEPEIDELMELLIGIARFPDEWTVEKWSARQKLPKAEVENLVGKLMVCELLVNVSASRYIVIDGLREFVWAVLGTTSPISIETTNVDDSTQIASSVERITGVQVQTLQIREDEKGTYTLTVSAEVAYKLLKLIQNEDPLTQQEGFSRARFHTFKSLPEQICFYFNESELKIEILLPLRITYEEISGKSKPDKCLELVLYCVRHGSLDELLALLREARPFVEWLNFD